MSECESLRIPLGVLSDKAMRRRCERRTEFRRENQVDGARQACDHVDNAATGESRQRAEYEDVVEGVTFRRAGDSRSGHGSTADGLERDARISNGNRFLRNTVDSASSTTDRKRGEHLSRARERTVDLYVRQSRYPSVCETASEVSAVSRSLVEHRHQTAECRRESVDHLGRGDIVSKPRQLVSIERSQRQPTVGGTR